MNQLAVSPGVPAGLKAGTGSGRVRAAPLRRTPRALAPTAVLPGRPVQGPETDAEFARIVDELSRRGFLGGGLGGAALLGLAACGSQGSSSSAAGASAGSSRAVATIHGTVRVPADPGSIVALDFPEACALLDLGVTPVGQPNWMPAYPAYAAALKGVPVAVDAGGKPELEKIAALKPGLIVGDDWAEPAKQLMPYANLAKIAPTALFAWQAAAGNWPELAAQTAAAIGKTAALNALKAKYDTERASVRATYAPLLAATTWDLIDCGADSWDLYSAASSHGKVLTGAGMRLNAGKDQSAGYVQYSLEKFGLLAATGAIVTTPASLPYLRKQPLFNQLAAVKAGHVYTTDLFFPASYGIATSLLGDFAATCKAFNANNQ